MKNLAFSAGQYRVDRPGATFVVTQNLFYESPEILSGTIIAPGRFSESSLLSENIYQIDTFSEYSRKTFYLRKLAKICRYVDSTNLNPLMTKISQDIENEISRVADLISTKQLEILLKKNIDIKVVIGFTGLSLNLGKMAKKNGLKYGIHSQFCHPNFQNEQLENAFSSLALKPPKVSKLKLERQLATIDIADFIWCPSEFVQNSHITNHVSKEKTFVSYLGIDVVKFQQATTDARDNNLFTILFVGNVGVQKGIHILLKAVELTDIHQMEVIFNGGSDALANVIIERYRNRLSNRNIKISIDPGDPRRYFPKASVLVLPSVHDSFGISVLEAMVAGLPVIVSDHVGAKEIVVKDNSGFVFSSGNSHELAEYIEFFYYNPDKIYEFGKKSAGIGKKFDVKKKGKELEIKILQCLC